MADARCAIFSGDEVAGALVFEARYAEQTRHLGSAAINRNRATGVERASTYYFGWTRQMEGVK
ncbi:hypothetical protein [Cryobacterium sp. Hh11]|uniref:hypothetical protein n=1 Tax=Cryobacterium sp. Hh11 TaxID=2555868 RepID=UPI00141A71F2|nr:hypothetical protein [Cryobacterium sp. Hh11]